MADYLDTLASTALTTINTDYYSQGGSSDKPSASLKQAILHAQKVPIIAEMKFASPSLGALRTHLDLETITHAYVEGGAIGMSVLTEPVHFHGQLQYINKIRKSTDLPILMKDFILDPIQITAAHRVGASAVLLIHSLYDRGYGRASLSQMIQRVHDVGLEVLLEVHTSQEFSNALTTDADMIGINNRDLRSLSVDIHRTLDILNNYSSTDRVIVSESGISTPSDIVLLRNSGVQAFLIGSALIKTQHPAVLLKELCDAI